MAVFPLAQKLEVAWGADPTGDPTTWVWTDETSRLLHAQPVTVRAGRADESSETQPQSASFLLDNPDGRYTPFRATSALYPNVKRGTPLRYSVVAGNSHMSLPGANGSRASTPDHASFDVTDLFLAVDVTLPRWRPASGLNYEAIGRYLLTGDQRSCLLFLSPDGKVRIRWTTAGTAASEIERASTAVLSVPFSGRLALGVHVDVDNGASGHTVRFLVAPRIVIGGTTAWALLSSETFSGTTSIFGGTAPLEIGDISTSGFGALGGEVHAAEMRNGNETGTIAANPNFAAQAPGTTSFADSTGKTWSLVGAASITKRHTALSGEVNEIAPTWPHGDIDGLARARITASGVFRRMGQGAKPLNSALYRLVTAPFNKAGVIAYWPAEDEPGAKTAASPTPGVLPMRIGSGSAAGDPGDVKLAADDTLAGSKPLPQAASDKNFGWYAEIPNPGLTTNWAVTQFFQVTTPETSPTKTQLMLVDASGSARTWMVLIDDTNVSVRAFDQDGASLLSTTFASDSRFFGAGTWIMVVLEITQDGDNIDWAVTIFPIPLGIGFGGSGTFAGTKGRPTRLRNLDNAPPAGISFGQFIVSTDLAIGWLAPADKGWVGETAGARITRLCKEEGISLQLHGDPAGTETMGEQTVAPLLELLRECARADMGMLAEQRHAPGIAYRSRATLYNQIPALTVNAATDMPNAGPFDPVLDDARLRNDITAKRPDGSSARIVNQASVDAEGRYDDQVTVNVATEGQLDDQAAWRVHLGTWPQMRYPAFVPDLDINSSLIDAWQHLGLGDLVRITNLPAEHPAGNVDLLLDSYAERIATDEWAPELNCSPAGPWIVGILDDDTPSTALARLGSDGSSLSAGINTTDTSLSVATPAGPLWTTSASYRPFGIVIGGEEMTVTNLTGASSPQTLTVTRSVNGVVKSHSSGAAVELASPFRLAL